MVWRYLMVVVSLEDIAGLLLWFGGSIAAK
jgi:hypothetical protein